jgi:putative DNA primase/helicase
MDDAMIDYQNHISQSGMHAGRQNGMRGRTQSSTDAISAAQSRDSIKLYDFDSEPPSGFADFAAINEAAQDPEVAGRILEKLGIDPEAHRDRPAYGFFDNCDLDHAAEGFGKGKYRMQPDSLHVFDHEAVKTLGFVDLIAGLRNLPAPLAARHVAVMIDRLDLIRAHAGTGNGHYRKQSLEALFEPNADNDVTLPPRYLKGRLGGMDPVMPSTRSIGIVSLSYFSKGVNVRHDGHPCAVFETIFADRPERNAQRIWLTVDGTGKADFGALVPKKYCSLKDASGARVKRTPGQYVLFGRATATTAIACEGIETGAAIATALRTEVEAGQFAVYALTDTNGVKAFKPGNHVTRLIVAADRDEGVKSNGVARGRAGEAAAIVLAKRYLAIATIALPGAAGTQVDWLDVFRKDGPDIVREGVLSGATVDALPKPLVSPAGPPSGGGGATGNSGGTLEGRHREVLLLNPTDDRANADEIERILKENKSLLYRSGEAIARVGIKRTTFPTVVHVAGEKRRLETTTIESIGTSDVNPSTVIDECCKYISFEMINKQGIQVACKMPPALAVFICSRAGSQVLPQIRAIVQSPTIKKDGELLLADGYDEETGIYLFGRNVKVDETLLQNPTKADAAEALRTLRMLMRDFAFVTNSEDGHNAAVDDDGLAINPTVSEAVAICMPLALVGRGSFSACPILAATATTYGSGKTMLQDVAMAIGIGRELSPSPLCGREEEDDKILNALLAGGNPVLYFDNVDGVFSGIKIALASSSPLMEVRILGTSQMSVVAGHRIIFANGNNLTPSRDLVRRTLICSLDIKAETSLGRTYLNAVNPLDMVRANRSKYVNACLTILRAYALAGYPDKPTSLDTYEEFSWHICGALMWLGMPNPMRSQEGARNNDPDVMLFRYLLAEMLPIGEYMTTGELIDHACGSHKAGGDNESLMRVSNDGLRGALMEIAGAGSHVSPKSLGKYLAKKKGAISEGLILKCQYDRKKKVNRWRVCSIDAEPER